ncbi:IS110 family transposase [Lentzea tibetensis]|uniref:IS110 family transposase n=1 Tax=Lentzea tibetensis TaxID=2591470 RepID=A0A563F229_9PSEU|nr:transposase [Lentzea tibetensis]TWP54020.1 IS110 family transposase [Lentzea tibetensis]
MTIPGGDVTVALSVIAAVGDVDRCASAEKLIAYLGLHPKIRQSGGQPAVHSRITNAGNAHTRGMLVDAAWGVANVSGTLRMWMRSFPEKPLVSLPSTSICTSTNWTEADRPEGPRPSPGDWGVD